jgi:hypothetical protein
MDVDLIRTRQGSRVLIDPLLASNDDGVAASLATALRRKRAWLHFVARRSLLVPSERLAGTAWDARIRGRAARSPVRGPTCSSRTCGRCSVRLNPGGEFTGTWDLTVASRICDLIGRASVRFDRHGYRGPKLHENPQVAFVV